MTWIKKCGWRSLTQNEIQANYNFWGRQLQARADIAGVQRIFATYVLA